MTYEEIESLAAAIAANLGWMAEPNPDRSPWYRLKGPGQQALRLAVCDRTKRITISGTYPHGPHGWYSDSRQRAADIGLAITSTPERITAEIRRRLLPRYVETLAEWEKFLAVQTAYEAAKRETLRRLAGLLGVPEPEEGKNFIYYRRDDDASMDFEASGTEVNLKGHISLALADKIALLLRTEER